jgi:formate hydrogenlyase subunit 3/multisubunit Na+/H+ antiporter MnhD subunit
MALLILSFFIVGFGTKAGLAPFHPWLPDAHAEAPSPVSALLSGVMIKTAIYALARVMSIFFPVGAYHPVAMFVIILGAFTMLLDAVMIMAQDDLKRMLAYSSVSQMGYIAMGLGLVGLGVGHNVAYLGGYGSVFHIVNHALSKAILFLAVGAVLYATAGRSMNQLRGLAKQMPVTGVCFFIAALAIAGIPPFSGFWSKLTLYLAGAEAHLWWAVGIAIASSLLTLAAFVRAGYKVFWSDGDPDAVITPAARVPVTMLVPMVALTLLVILFGLYPSLLYPLLDPAAKALAQIR